MLLQVWSLHPQVGVSVSLTSEPCLENKRIPCSIGSPSLRVYYKTYHVAASSPWFKNALQIQDTFLAAQELKVLNMVEIKFC